MSETMPVHADFDTFDVRKLVSSRRQFEGQIPLAAFVRLKDLLTTPDSAESLNAPPYMVDYRVEFGTDELKIPSVEITVKAELPLLCQRTLLPFNHPVAIRQRLGLLQDEADEAALPPDYEPMLIPADGRIRPLELVEDELIMAVPLVPYSPGTEMMEREWSPPGEETAAANPFAALGTLKKS